MARSRGARTARRRPGGLVDYLADHRGLVVAVVLLVVVIIVGVGAKVVGERSADSQTGARADEVRFMLRGASPEDFLAFNAGVKVSGSVAQQVRDQPDFVNVKATAGRSFIRFQPTGWWSGFTERCVVAEVTVGRVVVRVPKTACVRVSVPRN